MKQTAILIGRIVSSLWQNLIKNVLSFVLIGIPFLILTLISILFVRQLLGDFQIVPFPETRYNGSNALGLLYHSSIFEDLKAEGIAIGQSYLLCSASVAAWLLLRIRERRSLILGLAIFILLVTWLARDSFIVMRTEQAHAAVICDKYEYSKAPLRMTKNFCIPYAKALISDGLDGCIASDRGRMEGKRITELCNYLRSLDTVMRKPSDGH